MVIETGLGLFGTLFFGFGSCFTALIGVMTVFAWIKGTVTGKFTVAESAIGLFMTGIIAMGSIAATTRMLMFTYMSLGLTVPGLLKLFGS